MKMLNNTKCLIEMHLVNEDGSYEAFKDYQTNKIAGIPIIYHKNEWTSFNYLQYKDVFKICSFFFFNYGTIRLEDENSFLENNFPIFNIDITLDCPNNATSSKHCRINYLTGDYGDFSPMKIFLECSNRSNDNCEGEFVLTVYDTCYFLYKVKEPYTLIEMNDHCLKRNQTEIDLPTLYPLRVLLYLNLIFKPKSEIDILRFKFPWKFYSKIKMKNKFKIVFKEYFKLK